MNEGIFAQLDPDQELEFPTLTDPAYVDTVPGALDGADEQPASE